MSQGSDRTPDPDGSGHVPDRADWAHLGLLIRERRAELGLTQREVHSFGGPSAATLYQLESGRPGSYRPHILRRLERALGWGAGSVRRALAGQLPVLDSDTEPATTPAPDRAPRVTPDRAPRIAPEPADPPGAPDPADRRDRVHRADRGSQTGQRGDWADHDDPGVDPDGRAWATAFRSLPMDPHRKLALLAGLLQEMAVELATVDADRAALDGSRGSVALPRLDGRPARLDGNRPHLDGNREEHDGTRPRLDGNRPDHGATDNGSGSRHDDPYRNRDSGSPGNGGGPGRARGPSPLDRFAAFDPTALRGLPPLDPRTGGGTDR